MADAPWQHFLPACYLAGFSGVEHVKRRRSLLWVARRGGRVFEQTAERVGAAKHLYTLGRPESVAINLDYRKVDPPFNMIPNDDRFVIDKMWSAVEGRLSSAISAVSTGDTTLDAETWANVLVLFVAHVFVRGPDFNSRLVARREERFGGAANPFNEGKDHANITRLIEMMRLSGVLMRAEWNVVHAPPGSTFITNDLGRAPFHEATKPAGRIGYMLPLRRDTALYLVRGVNGPRLHRTPGDTWRVGPVHEQRISPEQVDYINRTLAMHARTEIFGATEAQLRQLHGEMGPNPKITEPFFASMPGEARLHEDLYSQFVDYISVPPSGQSMPFLTRPFVVPHEERTAIKLLQFQLPDQPPRAIAIPIMVHRLALDDMASMGKMAGIDERGELKVLMKLADEAVGRGERIEELVFVRNANANANGQVERWPAGTVKRIDDWLTTIRRADCCILITGVDAEAGSLIVQYINFYREDAPQYIGGPAW